jgi:hypothetical protein
VEHAKDWPKSVAKQVGARIAYFREGARDERGRKLTAQALADRCTELGLPIGRPAIAKMERGLRDTITVAELEVIARALKVSPADLMFPLGQAANVEVLPGEHMDTWDAVQWFSGLAPKPGRPPEGYEGVVHLYQLHHVILTNWLTAPRMGYPPRTEQEQAIRDSQVAASEISEAALRSVRADMRKRGLLPPRLPESVTWIDNGQEAPDVAH